MQALKDKLSQWQERKSEMKRHDHYFYHQCLEATQGSWARIGDKSVLLLSSYSYLGIQQDYRILSAVNNAWNTFGAGSHGSPLLAGTTELHLQLQSELGQFLECEDVMLLTSGYVANLATISTLCGPNDFIFSDKLNHASIVDGCALSGATVRRFRHNDVSHLERLLMQTPSNNTKLVIIDAVFSMDGDIADLPKISELCRRYGALLMVDEAHSLGVLGETGRGIEEHFGLRDAIDLKMGVLSKAIPASGGYIGGKKILVDYLRHHSRGYIFSGSMMPTTAAAALAGLRILRQEPWRVSRLRGISSRLRQQLMDLGVECGRGETPIVPVIIGGEEETLAAVNSIQNDGISVFGILPPAVRPGTCRLRICANGAMTDDDLSFAAQTVAQHVSTVMNRAPAIAI